MVKSHVRFDISAKLDRIVLISSLIDTIRYDFYFPHADPWIKYYSYLCLLHVWQTILKFNQYQINLFLFKFELVDEETGNSQKPFSEAILVALIVIIWKIKKIINLRLFFISMKTNDYQITDNSIFWY